jgi:Clp amino terminal domain, pathogenicity island component
MFERFTERARQVVVLAQEEARTLKHNYIGTEHILLGLLREEEGLAARVLESLDITVERVRGQVVRIVGSGEEVTSGQIPFTPRAKKVLELALREALSLGHNYIGTEHILLGLVRENEGVAARILLDFDADSEKIRNEVIRMLSGPSGRRRGPGPEAEPDWDETWQPSLRWEQARILWTPDGAALEVPLWLERRAAALLGESDVWQVGPLAVVRHEIRHGHLRITAPSLLETIDPRELRRVLDDAVQRAHDKAAQARSRDGELAEAFLASLREQPDP